MSLPYSVIIKTTARSVGDQVEYQDPTSDLHIRKGKRKDPHGDRRADAFWKGCGHSFHAGFSGAELSRTEVRDELVRMVLAVKKDDRNRPREQGVLRKLVWNAPSALMAQLRAIGDPDVRSGIVANLFRSFVHAVNAHILGPLIIDSHPDRHRIHFEAVYLLFDPGSNERYRWSVGMRMDGAGSTTFAENPDSKFCFIGVNSRIAGVMAGKLRDALALYAKTLAPSEREGFELRTKLQHVLLETTLAPVSRELRRKMNRERPAWLQALCAAWIAAPGCQRMDRRIHFYESNGMVTDDGFPILPDRVFEIPNFHRWVARGSRPTVGVRIPTPERVDWVRLWLQWAVKRLMDRKKSIGKRELRIIETLVHIDREKGTITLLRHLLFVVDEAVSNGLLSSDYLVKTDLSLLNEFSAEKSSNENEGPGGRSKGPDGPGF